VGKMIYIKDRLSIEKPFIYPLSSRLPVKKGISVGERKTKETER